MIPPLVTTGSKEQKKQARYAYNIARQNALTAAFTPFWTQLTGQPKTVIEANPVDELVLTIDGTKTRMV